MKARFPTGIDQIATGKCPTGAMTPMGCMVCSFGHMLECHHPHTCREVECSHYQMAVEAEREDPVCGEGFP